MAKYRVYGHVWTKLSKVPNRVEIVSSTFEAAVESFECYNRIFEAAHKQGDVESYVLNLEGVVV